VKKYLVLGIVGFVAALAVATGARLLLGQGNEETATAEHAEVVAGDQIEQSAPPIPPPETAPITQPALAKAVDEPRPVPEPAADPVQDTTVTQTPAPTRAAETSIVEQTQEAATTLQVSAPEPAVGSAADDTERKTTPEYRQLGKILTNMKAKDAAQIMAYLSDEETLGILRSLGVREVASLLSAMPVERAATLSQQLLNQPEEDR
jgi:outer membrane biosynthesis protein TonB